MDTKTHPRTGGDPSKPPITAHSQVNITRKWKKLNKIFAEQQELGEEGGGKPQWARVHWEAMAAFGDRTTCHGLPNILNQDKHRLTRLLWFFLTLVAVFAMVLVVYLTVQHFMRDPVSATIRERSVPSLPFPAITICNLNKIKKEIQEEWDKEQRRDKEEGNASNSTNQSTQENDVMLNDFLRFLSHEHDGDVAYGEVERAAESGQCAEDVRRMDFFREPEFRNLTQQLEFYQSFGHDETMVEYCFFNNMECENVSRSFQQHSYLPPSCITFNPQQDIDSHGDLRQTASGDGYLLEVRLNVQMDSLTSDEIGFKIAVHSPDELPNPAVTGFNIPTGFSTQIGVNLRRYNLVSGCSTKKRLDHFNFSYSQPGCLMDCYTDFILERCGCRYHWMGGEGEILLCNTSQLVCCFWDAYGILLDHPDQCNTCLYPCQYEAYDVTTGYSIYPSGSKPDDRLHVARVKIFFWNIGYTMVEEEFSYITVSFIAEIGGVLGLFIGISVLSVCELLDLGGTMLRLTLLWLSRREKGTTEEEGEGEGEEKGYRRGAWSPDTDMTELYPTLQEVEWKEPDQLD